MAPKLIIPTSTQQGRAVEVAADSGWSLLPKDGGDATTPPTLGGDVADNGAVRCVMRPQGQREDGASRCI